MPRIQMNIRNNKTTFPVAFGLVDDAGDYTYPGQLIWRQGERSGKAN
jgi:hypothetical protein